MNESNLNSITTQACEKNGNLSPKKQDSACPRCADLLKKNRDLTDQLSWQIMRTSQRDYTIRDLHDTLARAEDRLKLEQHKVKLLTEIRERLEKENRTNLMTIKGLCGDR